MQTLINLPLHNNVCPPCSPKMNMFCKMCNPRNINNIWISIARAQFAHPPTVPMIPSVSWLQPTSAAGIE